MYLLIQRLSVCSYYSHCLEMLGAIQRRGANRRLCRRAYVLTRQFSILENKLAFIDTLGEEVDRNGLLLPPVGSLVSYSTQRQYRVGVYCGKKNIDGLQKLQIRNEHDCIHDVFSFVFFDVDWCWFSQQFTFSSSGSPIFVFRC